MTTNDLMSLIADTAFRIGAGIIIDKAYIEYHLDQVEVYREGVLIYTNEDDFEARDGRIIHSFDVKRRMKALKTNGWLYLLSKIPTPDLQI